MSYSKAIFYLDYVNGSDAARSALAGCNLVNNGSGVVRCYKVGHGLVTGAVVTVPTGTYSGDWLINKIDNDNFDLFSERAGGLITVTASPSVNDTFVINTQTFTFKALRSGTGEITISSDLRVLIKNIADAVNTDLTTVLAQDWTGSEFEYYVTVLSVLSGTAGNSYTFTENATGVAVDGSGTLTGGANSTYSSDRNTVSVTPFGGMNWTDSWKTFSGATAARIAPGDFIRIAKSPVPYSIGSGKWSDAPVQATKNISSSTNATPVEITTSAAHGYSTGDIVQITGHNVNTAANGVWIITYVSTTKFTLDGSVGNGVGANSGTTKQINNKAVKLSTAQTLLVDNCETAWALDNGSGGGAIRVSTDAKQGEYCMQVIAPASPATTTLYAHKQISSTNFSAKTKLTFWFKCESAVVANNWKLCLCDDTAGASIQDTFHIPAIPAGYWVPLTITKNGGGNLYNAVQSIALYTDSVAPTASKYVLIDNINACTDFNLQSLISKETTETGQTEAWYGIQSIHDTIVLLDNIVKNKSTEGMGYSGASETVTTYARETIKTTLGTTGNTENTISDSGTSTKYIQYQGGYNTSTNLQDGMSFFDGLNGNGYLFIASSKTYILVNLLNPVRYITGFVDGSYMNFNNYMASNCLYSAFFDYDNGSILRFYSVSIVNGDTGFGYSLNATIKSYNKTKTIQRFNNSYDTDAWNRGLGLSNYSTIDYINKINNNSYSALNFNVIECHIGVISEMKYNYLCIYDYTNPLANNRIYSITTSNNTNLLYNLGNSVIIQNATCSESTKWYNYWGYELYFQKYNKLNGFAANYRGYGNIITRNATAGGTGVEWVISVTNSAQISIKPLILELAKVACKANSLVTVTCYFKKTHATDIGARLMVKRWQIAGVFDNVFTTCPSDTNRNQLTVSFTPTENGVVAVTAEVFWIANTADESVIVDDITITQA